jgi:Fur family ferric uptake transcriptional regulator
MMRGRLTYAGVKLIIIIIIKSHANSTVPMRRKTRQGRIVLEELRKLETHPTVAELYQIVRKRLPRISLATVYRNLEQLAEDGQVKKVAGGVCGCRFDCDSHQHCHVRCIQCGKVDDVCGGQPQIACGRTRSVNNFQILGHQLHFLGLCPDCSKRPSTTQ